MFKKKIILSVSIILVTLIIGSILIFKSENKLVKQITISIPTPIKNFTINTLFFIPKHFREFNFLKTKTSILQGKITFLEEENKAIMSALFSGKNTSNSVIKSKNGTKFQFKTFQLPWGNFWASDPSQRKNHKRHGYLDAHLDDVYVIFFSGKIIKFNSKNLSSDFLENEEINSNILDFLKNAREKWVGVKDILILENDIFVSYTKAIGDPKNDCYNTSILKGSLNSKYIIFKEFFTHEDCTNWSKRDGPAQAGGRMVKYKESILLTVGDFQDLTLYSTVENRLFSKILSIDLKTKKHKIVSKGHRNPQGLLYIEKKDLLISSEHGPKGGDEINRILTNTNEIPHYGWPIASHGTFYGFESTEIRKNIMKYKNHEDNGYVEPILVFEPSIGPSEVVRAKYKSDKSFLVSSLKNRSLYEFEYLKNEKSAKITDEIFIGERIRDIKLMKNGEYFLILGNTGSFAILNPL